MVLRWQVIELNCIFLNNCQEIAELFLYFDKLKLCLEIVFLYLFALLYLSTSDDLQTDDTNSANFGSY